MSELKTHFYALEVSRFLFFFVLLSKICWIDHEKRRLMKILLYYLLFTINIVVFLVYGIDKWKAKRGNRRISEATLLFLAVVGGSIGAWLGMRVWHHKTLHKKFKYGLPLILLAQIVLIGFLVLSK